MPGQRATDSPDNWLRVSGLNMKKKNNYLVFTDLDGTLLDHFNYQADAALTVINELKSRSIPIIPNTSKTFQEVQLICKELQLNGPFIIENGAAVYIPVNHFKVQPQGTVLANGYWVKSFCQTRDYWLSLLAREAVQYSENFIGFDALSAEQLAALTGLTIEKAKQAKTRQYSEPLHWFGDTVEKSAFIKQMEQFGANILQGGRFLHVSGHCDKGQAQSWLSEQYQVNTPDKKVVSIALGDSDNDVAMLEAANIAVQVRSPVHHFPDLKRQTGIYRSRECGPAGWAECLSKIIFSQINQ